MQEDMTATKRLLMRAHTFIQNETNDEEDREDAQTLYNRLMRADPENPQKIDRLSARLKVIIKGTRVSISLNEEEEQHAHDSAKTLLGLFEQYPHLSIPRKHTMEQFVEAFVKATKEAKK